MKSFLLILFLITTSISWANPDSEIEVSGCASKLEPAVHLQILEQMLKDPTKFSKRNWYDWAPSFQQTLPAYSTPQLQFGTSMISFLGMERTAHYYKWGRGEVGGVLFSGDEHISAKLEHNTPYRFNVLSSIAQMSTVKIRLNPIEAKKWVTKLVKKSNQMYANHISIDPDFTFSFFFNNLKDTANFIFALKDFTKNHALETLAIPFAHNFGSNIYSNFFNSQNFIFDINLKVQQQMNACEPSCDIPALAKQMLAEIDVWPESNLRKELEELIVLASPASLQPSPSLTAKLEDLTRLPIKARKAILQMAAHLEGHKSYLPFKYVYEEENAPPIPPDPEMAMITKEMNRILHDPEELVLFYAELMMETAKLILASNDENAKAQLRAGKFPRQFIYQVFTRWIIEEGFKSEITITNKVLTDADFRVLLKNWPFQDHAFSPRGKIGNQDRVFFHGIDVHIVQLLLIARRTKHTLGPQIIFKFINFVSSSPQNLIYWANLLDNKERIINNYTNPEVFTQTYTPHLELY